MQWVVDTLRASRSQQAKADVATIAEAWAAMEATAKAVAAKQREAKELTVRLCRGGAVENYGITFGHLKHAVVIVAIEESSPAQRVLLLAPMDRVVSINGVAVDSTFSILQLMSLMPVEDMSVDIVVAPAPVEEAFYWATKEAADMEALKAAQDALGQSARMRRVTLHRASPNGSYGLGLGFLDDLVVITSLDEGSPARACGLLAPWDRISAVNGVRVNRSTLDVRSLFPPEDAYCTLDVVSYTSAHRTNEGLTEREDPGSV